MCLTLTTLKVGEELTYLVVRVQSLNDSIEPLKRVTPPTVDRAEQEEACGEMQ